MNAGAASASGKVLLFLHADTQLPAGADCLVIDALKGSTRVWGRFNVMISGRGVTLGVIAALVNFRSRLTGIATGDQCIFMTREAFVAAGRFPEIALMEDIALSRQLKRVSRPICLGQAAVTSGRRWECNGIASTVVTMWLLRFAYFLGVNPALLRARLPMAGAGASGTAISILAKAPIPGLAKTPLIQFPRAPGERTAPIAPDHANGGDGLCGQCRAGHHLGRSR